MTDDRVSDAEMETEIKRVENRLGAIHPALHNPVRPLWLVTAVLVVAIIGVGVFLVVTSLSDSSESIQTNCKQRNEQLLAVNAKFGELNTLIEILTERSNGVLSEPEVVRAFDKLRQPIPTVTCK